MFLEDVFLSFFFFYPPAHVGPIVPVFSAAKLTPRHWSCHEVSEKSWQQDSAIPKLPSILPQQNKKEWRQRVKAVLSAGVDFWTIKWILHWIWIFFRQPTCSAMLGTHIKSGCKGRVGAISLERISGWKLRNNSQRHSLVLPLRTLDIVARDTAADNNTDTF